MPIHNLNIDSFAQEVIRDLQTRSSQLAELDCGEACSKEMSDIAIAISEIALCSVGYCPTRLYPYTDAVLVRAKEIFERTKRQDICKSIEAFWQVGFGNDISTWPPELARAREIIMGTIDGGLLDVAMKQAVQAMRGRSWAPVAIGVLMGVSRSIDNGVFSDIVLRSVFNMAKDPKILLVPVLAAKIGGKVGFAGAALSAGRAQKAARALQGAQAVFGTAGEILGLSLGAEGGTSEKIAASTVLVSVMKASGLFGGSLAKLFPQTAAGFVSAKAVSDALAVAGLTLSENAQKALGFQNGEDTTTAENVFTSAAVHYLTKVFGLSLSEAPKKADIGTGRESAKKVPGVLFPKMALANGPVENGVFMMSSGDGGGGDRPKVVGIRGGKHHDGHDIEQAFRECPSIRSMSGDQTAKQAEAIVHIELSGINNLLDFFKQIVALKTKGALQNVDIITLVRAVILPKAGHRYAWINDSIDWLNFQHPAVYAKLVQLLRTAKPVDVWNLAKETDPRVQVPWFDVETSPDKGEFQFVYFLNDGIHYYQDIILNGVAVRVTRTNDKYEIFASRGSILRVGSDGGKEEIRERGLVPLSDGDVFEIDGQTVHFFTPKTTDKRLASAKADYDVVRFGAAGDTTALNTSWVASKALSRRLIVNGGVHKIRDIISASGVLTIGSLSSATIRINGEGIAEVEATVFFDGESFLVDDGKWNHVGKKPPLIQLLEGQTLKVGNIIIQLSEMFPEESRIPVDSESAPIIVLPNKPKIESAIPVDRESAPVINFPKKPK